MATSTPSTAPSAYSTESIEASRVKRFANFFKSYMSVWTLVVAALPIPAGAFKLIPTFEAQRNSLSVYTSLFCFLSLGFIFFQRHRLGRYMLLGDRQGRYAKGTIFHVLSRTTLRLEMRSLIKGIVNWLPLACVVLSIYAVFRYQTFFEEALLIAQAQATAEEQKGDLPNALLLDMGNSDTPTKIKLANLILFENRGLFAATDLSGIIFEASRKSDRYRRWGWGSTPQVARELGWRPETLAEAQKFQGIPVKVPAFDEVLKTKAVPLGNSLMFWYLTIFIAAEAAFILMALKEYLLDIANISDLSLMGFASAPESNK